MIVNEELPVLSHSPSIWLVTLKKTMKNLSHHWYYNTERPKW
jgi:hypothetical protein